MKQYRTKVEAYLAGKSDMAKEMEEYALKKEREGFARGMAQQAARAKKKLDPLYNRPVALKERVDREAEVEFYDEEGRFIPDFPELKKHWQSLGKTKQPSLWSRFVKFINPKQYLM